MPRRPPKKWFRKTVKSLKRKREIKEPKALAGWIWYHHVKPTTKRTILRKETRSKTKRKKKGRRKR